MHMPERLCVWGLNNCRDKKLERELFLVERPRGRAWKHSCSFLWDENVIWTNKLWRAVDFKWNMKGKKNSQFNFPTKSRRRFFPGGFFVSILLQAVIPTWKASASCLLLSLTAKDREPGASVPRPHAPGKCIHPQLTPQRQLHRLINTFNLTLLLQTTDENTHI